MYVDDSPIRRNGKTYPRALIRDSYREDGKIKHHTIANISKCPKEEIAAIKLALKHKGNLSELIDASEEIKLKLGLSVGSVFTLNTLCKRLGITKALGSSKEAKLSLWMAIARIIEPGSKLANVRLANRYAACDVLDLESFNEDNLYKTLEWLADNQTAIEKRLFRQKYPETAPKPTLFLYDVTSSYLEGTENELAAFGYPRDKKMGKKQIVIGLLTDKDGDPISVEVFKGNTADPTTFFSQIEKTAERFGCKDITMVGDRGMIKSAQIEALSAQKENFHYITAITKPQINTLIEKKVFQTGLFDEKICEVDFEEVRYILRKNPVRVVEIAKTRESKLDRLREEISEQNTYLAEHRRAWESAAISNVNKLAERLKINGFAECKGENRVLSLEIDWVKLEEISLLDGCYVIKTDLPEDAASKETIHDRYKDLKYVEEAFRMMKTVFLEIRPLYLRNAKRTRGHVFMVMLAYKVGRFLKEKWEDADVTVEEGVSELSAICCVEVRIRKVRFNSIPEARELGKRLLGLLEVVLPEAIRAKGVEVSPRKSLGKSGK